MFLGDVLVLNYSYGRYFLMGGWFCSRYMEDISYRVCNLGKSRRKYMFNRNILKNIYLLFKSFENYFFFKSVLYMLIIGFLIR